MVYTVLWQQSFRIIFYLNYYSYQIKHCISYDLWDSVEITVGSVYMYAYNYIPTTAATAADTESKEKHNITIAADCVYYNYGGEQQVLDIREENKICC